MKKLIMASITAVVVIVVLAGTLIPILDDATSNTKTLTNEGYMRYTSIASTDADSLTISWDHTAPTKITVGSETLDIVSPAATMSMVFADNFTVRYDPNNATMECYGTAGNVISASVADSTDMTVTLSSGTASIANTESTPDTASYSYTTAYYPDADGEYIMKYANGTAYVNPEDTIILANGTTIVGSRVGIFFSGTIEDGYTFNYFNTNVEVTANNVQSNYTELEDYVDVVSLSEITFTLTKGTDTANAAYSYFLVPYQITAEKAVHFTDGENAILNAIPVLVIVALLLGIVAMVLRSRMD